MALCQKDKISTIYAVAIERILGTTTLKTVTSKYTLIDLWLHSCEENHWHPYLCDDWRNFFFHFSHSFFSGEGVTSTTAAITKITGLLSPIHQPTNLQQQQQRVKTSMSPTSIRVLSSFERDISHFLEVVFIYAVQLVLGSESNFEEFTWKQYLPK